MLPVSWQSPSGFSQLMGVCKLTGAMKAAYDHPGCHVRGSHGGEERRRHPAQTGFQSLVWNCRDQGRQQRSLNKRAAQDSQ